MNNDHHVYLKPFVADVLSLNTPNWCTHATLSHFSDPESFYVNSGTLSLCPSPVLDSSGKFPPSGILEGTLTDLGRFDECLDIDVMLDKDDDLVSTGMRGQYCSVLIRPPLPPQPRFHTFCNQIPSLVATSSDDSVCSANSMFFSRLIFKPDCRLSGGSGRTLSISTTHLSVLVSVLHLSAQFRIYKAWSQRWQPNSTWQLMSWTWSAALWVKQEQSTAGNYCVCKFACYWPMTET